LFKSKPKKGIGKRAGSFFSFGYFSGCAIDGELGDNFKRHIDNTRAFWYNKISDFYMILKGDDFRIPTAYARGPKRKN